VRTIVTSILVATISATTQSGQKASTSQVKLLNRFGQPKGLSDGILELRPRDGWVSADRLYSDFVLAVEYRLVAPDARFVVTVRARAPVSEKPRGYEVTLPGTGASSWQSAEIRADGPHITLSVNGSPVASESVQRFAGHVLLEVNRGSAELRNITIAPIVRPFEKPDNTVTEKQLESLGGQGPKLVHEVRPYYTRDAMRSVVQGVVKLEAVVLPDGSVGAVRVTRSLHRDLDVSALGVVREWKFAPATLNGNPVPFLAEIDVSFKLK
jgi:TonB family protein